MSHYVPDANDPTEPVDTRPAGTAAEELRALKALVAGLVVTAAASAGPRQCIVDSQLDANGYNNAISAGAGLRVGLSASATNPYQLSFATGFTGGKPTNSEESIDANVADLTAADLAASSVNFIYRNFGVNWESCLIPPQYGYAFDRAQASILNFEGNDGSIIINDDLGHTWTLAGNAQIDTAQFKFGTSSLLLDNAGDWIETTSITSLGGESWSMEAWVRWNALPVGTTDTIFGLFGNAGTANGLQRARLDLVDTGAAVYKTRLGLNDGVGVIVAAQTGTKNTWNAGQWYHFALVYDALAGKYFVYVDGVKDQEFTSASRVGAGTHVRIGRYGSDFPEELNGWVDGFRIIKGACIYPNGTTFVPQAAAPAITDYPMHFFSIPKMKMYEATGASPSTGQPPVLTARTRLFVGEADTNAIAVTAVRNYAVRGEFISDTFTPASTTLTTKQHNIGVAPQIISAWAINLTQDSGYIPNQRIRLNEFWDGTPSGRGMTMYANRNTVHGVTGTTALSTGNATNGGISTLTNSRWKVLLEAKRGW